MLKTIIQILLYSVMYYFGTAYIMWDLYWIESLNMLSNENRAGMIVLYFFILFILYTLEWIVKNLKN